MKRVIIVGETGTKDAVIAAAFATDGQVPILFVQKDGIPLTVWDEIRRLEPDEILVFGGIARVGENVLDTLLEIAPVVRRIAGGSVFATSVAASQELHPFVIPDPDPELPPPAGLYIPKLEGPILKHDGNPTVLGSIFHNDGKTHTYRNVKVVGNVRAANGSTILMYDSEIDGGGGDYCAAGWGGHVDLTRCELHNAEDGVKDNVDTQQVTIHKLHKDSGGHGDCIQLQSGGADAVHRYSYFDGFYQDGSFGNSAIIVKHDVGNDSPQKIRVESCYVNGGNWTVYVHHGEKGHALGEYSFRDMVVGGDHRHGLKTFEGPVIWEERA